MAFTESELCLIEQLCYIDPELIKAATGKEYSKQQLVKLIGNMENHTVLQILDKLGLNEAAITRLEKMARGEIKVKYGKNNKTMDPDAFGGAVAGADEWADIIRNLRSSDVSGCVLRSTMPREDNGTLLAMCFTEPGKPDSAIVAFKGTSGVREWEDDFEGLNLSDTECQKEALEYFESLPYDGMTVIGHSKGGNKAMYVTIKTDKVARCISYDGQGFSEEFMEKYWAEIELRGDKITNISLSTDFVHALLFQIPGSQQLYCKGHGVGADLRQNHSPNSFFIPDEDGSLKLVFVEEDPSIRMLHEFTTFILNNADAKDKRILVDYLAPLAGEALGESAPDMKRILDLALKKPDGLATTLAYLVAFMETGGYTSEDISGLLKALGGDELAAFVSFLLDGAMDNLTDGKTDELLNKYLFPILDTLLDCEIELEKGPEFLRILLSQKYNIDLSKVWAQAEAKAKQIDRSGGVGDAKARNARVRDFSLRTYNTLMDAINRIERMQFGSLSDWKNYSDESWYKSLLVSAVVRGLELYANKLSEENQEHKRRIRSVFEEVHDADRMFAKWIEPAAEKLRQSAGLVAGSAESLR